MIFVIDDIMYDQESKFGAPLEEYQLFLRNYLLRNMNMHVFFNAAAFLFPEFFIIFNS